MSQHCKFPEPEREGSARRPRSGGRWRQWVAAIGLAVFLVLPVQAGIPAPFAPVVIQPLGAPARAEFDLTAVLERARRENKWLYVYLGASNCSYCRKYEAFLEKNAVELVPHFSKYIVVDLRSSLSVTSDALFIRIAGASRPYVEFQKSIGDERTRAVVYPSVWLLDGKPKPLMQMPAGTGTFQTVAEQLEILRLEQ